MSVFDLDRLYGAVKQLGDAALDPARWPILMQEICEAVNVTGAALVQSDVRTADIPMTESVREIFQSYFYNNIHLHDVRALRSVPLLGKGVPAVRDQDIFSSETEMLRDPLYADLDKFGFRWWMAVGFSAGSSPWGLSFQRTKREGAFQAHELEILANLSHRLTETATLSKAVGRLVLIGKTDALDLIKKPAIALDRYGTVLATNSIAHNLFDSQFRIRGGRVYTADKTAKAAFESLEDNLRNTPDTKALICRPIVVRREISNALIVRVLPVDGAAKSPFLGARAILVLTEVGFTADPNPTALLEAFNLTPAEARLAIMLSSGLSLEQVAEKLSVSRQTVRNQLKALFAKTGTHRQGELIALISQI